MHNALKFIFSKIFFCYSIYQNNMTKTLCLGMKLGFLFFLPKAKAQSYTKINPTCATESVTSYLSCFSSII